MPTGATVPELQGRIERSTLQALALSLALGAAPVGAISPDLSLTQLGHTAWRVQDDGLPGRPTAIAQTNDGYIWIGTQAGLVRFDGAAFVLVAPPPGEAPRFPAIVSLNATKDGSLWIGTPTQLLRLKSGKFHLYEASVGTFAAVREAPDGKIWTTRYRTGENLGPLCEVGESSLACYGTKQGIPFRNAGPLAIEESGAIWIATANKLARWQAGQSQIFAPSGLSRSEGLEGFKSVVVAPDGSIWSGVINGGPGLGLQHFTDGEWRSLINGDIDTSTWQVNALLFDRHGTLWVGTANRGIYRIRASSIDHFGVGDGLSADSINAFCEDKEGNLWAVTANGIDKFRTTRVVTFSSRHGLSSDGVNAVLASKSGAVWVSNATALDRIDGGKVKSYSRSDGFPAHAPTALFENSPGRLWLGADDGVAVFEHERFSMIRNSTGGPVGPILEFAQGPESTVWGVTATEPSRLLRMNAAEVLETIPSPTKSRMGAFAAASDGALWVSLNGGKDLNCDLGRYSNGHWDIFPLHTPPRGGGCSSVVPVDPSTVFIAEPGGIGTWHDGTVRTLTVNDGLPCPNTYALLLERHENLWLYQECGVAVIGLEELVDWMKSPTKRLHFRLLDVYDGALPGRADFHPRAEVGADGKIWFANGVDLQFVDPEHWSRNTVVPPVHIQVLRADNRLFTRGSPITLPALTRDVQIDFTALSFVVPQKVQFQYRLEGWDIEWQRAAGRRQAFYTNLRPGTYRFSVLASNDDALWNTQGDTLQFKIEPAYYQTWWFRLLCAAALLILMQAAYALRLRRAETIIRQRLAARLGERERIARELHDTFLQSIQGLVFKFDSLAKTVPSDSDARKRFEGILAQVDDVISEGRARVLDLRGADQPSTELAYQLNSYGSSFQQRSSAAFKTSVVGEPLALNPVTADEILIIGREAINNCFTHGDAKHIEVELIYDEKSLALRVRDDGKGMDAETAQSGRAGHWGIVGMRERAKSLGATLNIWSRAGSGTEIELTVRAATAYSVSGTRSKPRLIERLFYVLGMRKYLKTPQSKS